MHLIRTLLVVAKRLCAELKPDVVVRDAHLAEETRECVAQVGAVRLCQLNVTSVKAKRQ